MHFLSLGRRVCLPTGMSAPSARIHSLLITCPLLHFTTVVVALSVQSAVLSMRRFLIFPVIYSTAASLAKKNPTYNSRRLINQTKPAWCKQHFTQFKYHKTILIKQYGHKLKQDLFILE